MKLWKLKITFVFAWYDLWIGAYYDRKSRALYIFPVPMLGLKAEGAASDSCPARCSADAFAGYTYKSTQATNCAVCGQYKHTPLRNDEMGGYVCLTCIDKELSNLQAASLPNIRIS